MWSAGGLRRLGARVAHSVARPLRLVRCGAAPSATYSSINENTHTFMDIHDNLIVAQLVDQFREHGHLVADLDPLGR